MLHVKLSRQNPQDSQGLVAGAEHHPGGEQAAGLFHVALAVAAQVQALSHFFRPEMPRAST